ncbi:hypothetical protein NKH47_12685 [Mesorhizobium sp. M1060]|uniref:hypothetical protein n=1 Tax=unclassified Mesorhizobium TaxID=325217 RepID=UPI0003D0162C|nr:MULTISPECIES: hypothetical protein [unclassified Mesorhizobium]ESZ09322.1 hypothetical protein X736_04465 [Mesorhizobium sp. L2C089B000]WJI48441.1 hypothetical protein NLY44_17185 [Mesorhizobium sp. C089B]
MNLRGIIAAEKSAVDTGDWKRGEIPRSKWPSRRAKAKAYKYGPLYQWRILFFQAAGQDCRVLLLFNESKRIFRATLGVTKSGETLVICDYEYHASEPGWHCHARCSDLAGINSAHNRFGGVRLPKAGSFHRRTEFRHLKQPLSAQTAFNCAISIFKIDRAEGMV